MHGISKASVCRELHDVMNDIKFAQVIDWSDDIYNVVVRFSRIAQNAFCHRMCQWFTCQNNRCFERELTTVCRCNEDHSINVMAV